MRITIPFPKGSADLIGNEIRRTALTKLKSWRPVGFRFESMSTTLVHLDPYIAEDTPHLYGNISDLVVIPKNSDAEVSSEYTRVSFTFNDKLTDNKLTSPEFDFKNTSGYDSIVNLLDKDKTVTLTLLMRYCSGIYDANENASLAVNRIADSSTFVYIGSRHTYIDKFTYDVEEVGIEEENLILDIESQVLHPKKIVQNSLEELTKLLVLVGNHVDEI